MSTFLDSKKEYGSNSWEKVSTEVAFDKDDLQKIVSIVVTSKEMKSKFDDELHEVLSMEVLKTNGRKVYLQLDRDSELEEGDVIDPQTVELITLENEDEEYIERVDGKILVVKKGKKK